ncbi:MAG: hypothetical protein BGO98_47800 [Myxococcales bacterium 68-20]|nr:MAG: hypothetical protein BGO98_47800 [Myxococcales bacterium 68-20]
MIASGRFDARVSRALAHGGGSSGVAAAGASTPPWSSSVAGGVTLVADASARAMSAHQRSLRARGTRSSPT